ncbi:hypothetical protein B9Z19DRAFT_1125964 [Tuber borchii]|uniref:Helicase C-terminal domain-containing protein n=1 Tax=Tuber borchii TaxID=42251 RepID=A0A2T6ZTX2_TUBBO|nr:hypothetical protein B9Z19DRAFT_1125964 [Tuber borchii]
MCEQDSTTVIENEWLSPPRFTAVRSSVDLTGVREDATGDFDIRGLGQAVNTYMANQALIKAWIDRASERKSTLVFCIDIAHVRSIMLKSRAHGIDARDVTSKTSTQVHRECLKEFKAGKFPVMVTCGVFTEGTDIPNIDCLRKLENTGETDCHIIDMVANLSHGVVTTPTLFGLDPDMVVNEMTPEQMFAAEQERARVEKEMWKKEEARLEEDIRKLKEKWKAIEEEAMKVAEQARVKAKKAALAAERRKAEEEMRKAKSQAKKLAKEAEHQILQEEKRLRAIAAEKFKQGALGKDLPSRTNQVFYSISRLAWVSIGPTKYILSCGRNGHITVETDSNEWYNVEEVRALPLELGRVRWTWSKPIMSGIEQLDLAIRGCWYYFPLPPNLFPLTWSYLTDTYVLKTYPRHLVARSALWRKLPASDQQVEFPKKIRFRGDKDWEDMGNSGELTKGKVGDIITRVKHGTVRLFSEKKKEQKNKEKEEAKKLMRRQREEVKVGSIV